jgi:hypothetical protein
MINQILMYAAAIVLFLWILAYGLLGLPLIRRFKGISEDTMRIMSTMWSLVGMMQLFIVGFLLSVTWMGESSPSFAAVLYLTIAIYLIGIAIFLLFDWKRMPVLIFRIMPFVMIVVAGLIFMGLFFDGSTTFPQPL